MSQDLGNGFWDHGVATPTSTHRGTVATVDGDGRNVVLVLLYDHRGGYALLLIDAESGKSEQFPTPFPIGGDGPFASILSSANRFYTHFNSHFVEFDPAARAFTFVGKTAPQMAMGMTEDDNGCIWSVTYPHSGVAWFDPASREFRDFGHVYKQNWRQYQRHVAADDAGWVYFAVGNTASQIVAFDPTSGVARPMLREEQRTKGCAYVYRDEDGKVYGTPAAGAEDGWYAFRAGEAKEVGRLERRREKPIITGTQGLFHRDFPDGKRLADCDLIERVLTIEDPGTGTTSRLPLDYTSEGAHVMGLAVAPDDTVCGGTTFPKRLFRYDPNADAWTNRANYGQWNAVAPTTDRFFVGGYTGGFLLEWDPSRPWVATEKGRPDANPRFLTECKPTINRPHDLLVHPDGKTVVLAGTPDYGYTGGGLLFWDRQTGAGTLIEHEAILPEHSTMSLVALPGGKLLGGTTTSPGTGGEKKATEAALYVMDMASKEIEWSEVVFAGVQEYTDMCPGPDGLVLGIADRKRCFVFDPVRRRAVHEEDVEARLGLTPTQQGPRVFVSGPGDSIYMLFIRAVARVDLSTFAIDLLADSPVPVAAGGAFLDGRIYFASGSHVCSYGVADGRRDPVPKLPA